jgi:hypothetical protein
VIVYKSGGHSHCYWEYLKGWIEWVEMKGRGDEILCIWKIKLK